jgi:Tol biopolymer transport system component
MKRNTRLRERSARDWSVSLLSALAASVILFLQATPASATFPGPDGRIAFGSDRYGDTQNIFTMNPDGSDVRQLTFLTGDRAALEQSWSPDGTKLAFEERDAAFTFSQIHVMNADGSDRHPLFSDPSYLEFAPSYSPDGTPIVFSRCRMDFEACAIYSVKSDGRGMTAVTHLDVRQNVLDFDPEYSPDGSTIAFTSINRGGVQAAVYLMGSRGTNVRELTPASLEAFDPDWSPDGSRVVFSTHCCTAEHSAIWGIGIDGSGLEQVTFPGDDYDFAAAYAPAGDSIAFERDSSDFSTSSILTVDPDGSGLTTIQSEAIFPAWGRAT